MVTVLIAGITIVRISSISLSIQAHEVNGMKVVPLTGALQNQTPPRKEQVAWVREKIPLHFGFCKKPFELKLPRFALACICHLLRKFLQFREQD